MKSREEIIEQLLKIQTLAERGVCGEKTSAQEMLVKLMKKYEVTEEELFQDKVNYEIFAYKNDIEKSVLVQIIVSILGNVDFYRHTKKRKVTCVRCTKYQRIEIEMKYNFYLEKFYEELEIFEHAFYIKNDLFCKDAKGIPEEEVDPIELAKIRKMVANLDKHTMVKAIESRD